MANFIDNVRYALDGIQSFFRTERNGRRQGLIAIIIIMLGFAFKIDPKEWLWVLGCIALVISLEMVNSAIEKVCNLITTDYSPAIKTIKDIAAGAVLFSAIIAVAIGSIIFLPYVLRLF
ncbi:MAG: diacylglycerol kinase family protein [Sphingobacteriales bacterium]|nr:MAG: diacylglycerol kinase family protein [Sphingobacteriales bacterium]